MGREFAGTKATLRRLFILIFIVGVFSIPLAPKVIIFCHVSAWKCSKLWALTLTLCRALNRWEVLRHHRTPWSVCTNCPPWSHSCSKPSAGISSHSYHCCQSERVTGHSASLPISHYALCVSFIFSLLTLAICVKEAMLKVFILTITMNFMINNESQGSFYVKGVANYHPSLQFPSAHCFSFPSCNCTVLFHLPFSQSPFWPQKAAVFLKKALKKTADCAGQHSGAISG